MLARVPCSPERGAERIKGTTGRLRGLLPFAGHLLPPAQDHVWTLALLVTEVCHPRASAHQRPLVEGSRATSSGLTRQQVSKHAFHVDRHQPWLAWPSLNLRRFVSVCGFGVLRARGPRQSLESQDRCAQQCYQGAGQAQTLGTHGASPGWWWGVRPTGATPGRTLSGWRSPEESPPPSRCNNHTVQLLHLRL